MGLQREGLADVPGDIALVGFLGGYSGLTREAYQLDLRQYVEWCTERHVRLFGARRADIRLQFLLEAVFISLTGGLVGTILGLAMPYSIRFFTNYRIPISGLSALIALFSATLVGVVFGTLPATRAAQMDPVESLKYE